MSEHISLPFYAKFALISIGAFAFVSAMYLGQQIILPLLYATIIAILLNPVVGFLTRLKINRVVAISLTVLFAILISISFLYFMSSRLSMFQATYPRLKVKFLAMMLQIIHWVSINFNVNATQVKEWISDKQNDILVGLEGSIGATLSTINSVLIVVFLLPVYMFMILFYKELLLVFIRKLFGVEHHEAVFAILFSSKKIIQSYLVGLLLEAAIVATLNSIGLLILGIDYAIILGITSAVLNVIPYIGGVIAILIPMTIAFVTKDSYSSAIGVLGVYLFIQFVDNHYIIPNIVASKVKINALVSVVVVLVGHMVWGLPGMFLSIPLTAIVKVIFDHIEPLKPWGYLLGNIVPTAKQRIAFTKKGLASIIHHEQQ